MEEPQNQRPHLPTPQQYLASLPDDGSNQPASIGPIRPKRRWFRKVLIITVLIAGLFGIHTLANLFKLSINPFDFGQLKGEQEGRINFLFLGVGDAGHEGADLSDTVMVASLDTKNNQLALISIPRDLRVNIPGYGYHKINEAHADGGPDLSRQVVEQTLGIPIHYYARVNFTGLSQAVDAVGGIDINVTDSLYDPEYPCDKNQYRSCGLIIKKGQQHMDGVTALKYARCRKGNCGDDFGRALRQQAVIQAVRQKALSAGSWLNPIKISNLATALGDNVKTDLSINQMLRVAKKIQSVGADRTYNIVFSTSPGAFLSSTSGSDLVPEDGNFEAIRQFTKDVFKLGPIWVEAPSIIIQNGTDTVGLGSKLKNQIITDDYRIDIAALANAPKGQYPISQIIDYSNSSNPHTAAYLEGLLGVKVTKPETTVKSPPSDFRIILGDDYAAAQAKATATPTK